MNMPSSNPFTGLKGALAGLMSGGWMGLLLSLVFRRRIHAALTALEGLFAQWKAGTLKLPDMPAPVRSRVQAAAPAPVGASVVARLRRRSPRVAERRVAAAPRERVVRVARVWAAVWCDARVPRLPARAPRLLRRRGRCTAKRRWQGDLQHAHNITISQ
jgi:hypothetical protein